MNQLDELLSDPEARAAWELLPPQEKVKVEATLYPEVKGRVPGPPVDERPPGFMELLSKSPTLGYGQQVNPVTEQSTPQSGADLVRMGSALPPGLLGIPSSMAGSAVADMMEGEFPSWKRALGTGALVGAVGQGSRLLNPLSKVRVVGTGRKGDAAIAARAVREAGTALQPKGGIPDLYETMRGTSGSKAVGERLATARSELADKLPTQSPKGVPMTNTSPLSREQFLESTGKLTDLGDRGFNLQGAARDSPAAVRARRQYGSERKDLTGKLEASDPWYTDEKLKAFETQQRDFSAAAEMRRHFRPSSGEGQDRVFRPGGFNLGDLQERASKRVAETQGRLGKESGDKYLETLFRGGKPGEPHDRSLAFSVGKGGLRIPTGLELKAGPGMDPTALQMFLQGLSPGLVNWLSDALNKPYSKE